jgi:LEA14-like dessication related protein
MFMKRALLFLLVVVALYACAPKEPVVLREVHIRSVDLGKDGKNPVLKADAILYNPNKGSLRLKEIDLDILLNEKPAARIDQKLNAQIKGQSEFTVPLEVQLSLNDSGLLDTILSLFGGKKYDIRFTGKIKVSVGGFPVKIPVDHKDVIRF